MRTMDHRLPIFGDLFNPPRIRGECLAGTPLTGSHEQRVTGQVQCGAFACRHNLLTVHSADVPGKRYSGVAPEWTLSGENTSAGAASCALDVAESGPKTSGEIAKLLGISRRRVEQVLKRFMSTGGAVTLAELQSALLANVREGSEGSEG